MYSCIEPSGFVEMKDGAPGEDARKAWMSLLARAPEGRAAALLDAAMARPGFDWLRPPEIGSVMVRGRAGAPARPSTLAK
jgi:alpha-D-ribose 1-methylphosphonate 5-triphosphate synthase subunit PhnG